MNELIGLTGAARILRVTRSGARYLWERGEIQAMTFTDFGERRSPLFLRQHVEDVARKREERTEAVAGAKS